MKVTFMPIVIYFLWHRLVAGSSESAYWLVLGGLNILGLWHFYAYENKMTSFQMWNDILFISDIILDLQCHETAWRHFIIIADFYFRSLFSFYVLCYQTTFFINSVRYNPKVEQLLSTNTT